MSKFKDLKYYVMFIGPARSGHSIMGMLLDAHPDIVCAHEYDLVKNYKVGSDRNRIFNEIINKAATAARGSYHGHAIHEKGRFSYAVKNQYQGRYRRIEVIGHKKGSVTVNGLGGNYAETLGNLQQFLNLPIKLIHVRRNPFDNIATVFRAQTRMDMPAAPARSHDAPLIDSIDYYFKIYEKCKEIEKYALKAENFNFHSIKQEDFIKNPYKIMSGLCKYLEVEATEEYLNACSGIVYKRPHQARYKIKWDETDKANVQNHIDLYDDLKEYKWET